MSITLLMWSAAIVSIGFYNLKLVEAKSKKAQISLGEYMILMLLSASIGTLTAVLFCLLIGHPLFN